MIITCRLISDCVREAYCLPVGELYARRRSPRILVPRRMAWRLARELTAMSYPVNGRNMGGVDHTTVMHGLKKLDLKMAREHDLVTAYDQLKARVLSMASEDAQPLDPSERQELQDLRERANARFSPIDRLRIAGARKVVSAFRQSKLRRPGDGDAEFQATFNRALANLSSLFPKDI